ncbi:hypothetical protein BH11CYA1_BH11CYA1_43630 [soil metagenome]
MKPRQLLIVILALGLLCIRNQQTSNRPEPSSQSTPLSDLTVSNYFPPSAGLTPKNGAEMCETLKSCKERPLFERAGNGEAYRFILLHSKGKPVCVTLYSKADGAQSALITKTQIKETLVPERLRTEVVERGEEPVEATTFAELLKNFDSEKFWQIDRFDEYTGPPLYDFELFGRRCVSDKPSMKDGVLWIIEGIKNGQYRTVQRQSPSDDDAVEKLGTILMNQAKQIPLHQ